MKRISPIPSSCFVNSRSLVVKKYKCLSCNIASCVRKTCRNVDTIYRDLSIHVKKESNEIFLTRKRLEANSELLLASNYTFNYIGTIIRLYFHVGDKCEKSGIWIIHNTKGYNNYVDFTEHRLNREMAHHYASRNFVGQTSLRENFRAPDSWLIINIYTLKYWPFDSVCRKWRI